LRRARTKRSLRRPEALRPAGPAALAAAAIALFLLLASRNIDRPGPHTDELITITPVLGLAEGGLAPGTDLDRPTGPAIPIGGGDLPLMSFHYIGGLKSALAAPVAAIGGLTPTGVRWFHIALAVVAMACTWLFARGLFRDGPVAAVGLVLLAIDPGWVFYSRTDFGPVLLMIALKALAGWCFVRWWDERRDLWFYGGCALLGLGLHDKLNFAWVIAGFAVGGLVVGGRELRRRLGPRLLGIGAALTGLGLVPALIHNLDTDWSTLRSASRTGEFEGSLPRQLAQRLWTLEGLVEGRLPAEVTESPFRRLPLIPALCTAAGAWAAWAWRRGRLTSRESGALGLLLVSSVVVVLCAAATGAGFKGHHLMTVYPAPHLVLAAAIVYAARRIAERSGRFAAAPKAARIAGLVAALAAVPVAASLANTLAMQRAMERTGGSRTWSDSIHRLSHDLRRQRASRPVITADFGIASPLVLASDRRLSVRELTFRLQGRMCCWRRYSPAEVGRAVRPSDLRKMLRDRRIRRALADPRPVWVLHSPWATSFKVSRARFFEGAKAVGRRPRLLRVVPNRQGRPLYEIYELARSG
jgi:hypothetical protein